MKAKRDHSKQHSKKYQIGKRQTIFLCLGFMVYQTLYVIYCQIHFYTNKQIYFKQFSLE